MTSKPPVAAYASISESWAAIDHWLLRYAPASAEFLAAPADPAEIATAEAAIGWAFPAELIESLRQHNGLRGWANLMPETVPLSVARIVEHWQMCMEIAEDVDGFATLPGSDEPWWHELWLPFAESDGDAQVIDLRPGPGCGRLGWAVHDNGGDFDNAWPNLGAYLAETADVLQHGGNVNGWWPYLTTENELWWDRADQTEVNGDPLRPAPHG